MRYLLLAVFLFCLLPFLSGQSFDFPKSESRIYPVSAHLIDAIIEGKLEAKDLPELPEPYPVGINYLKLPASHYLKAKLYGEEVEYEYFHTYDYELEISAANGNFQVRIHDAEGEARPDATVTADNKPVRYRKKHHAYQRRDWRIGNLKVIVDKDTLFYRVDEAIKRSRFAHDVRVIGARQPFRTLKKPYYYGASIYHSLRDGIGRDYWHWPRNYPLQRTINGIVNPQAISGYVTTSQPRYRPGDSLRLSAYLAYAKGRPLGIDSVDMRISTYGRGARKNFRAKVGGNDKGRYTHAMAIPPDWPLDQSYTVSFSLPGWRWRDVAPSIRFKLQDYELAEYELTTKVSDDARLPGSAWLDVKAEDVNGLPLPNGNLKVTVHLENFVASRDSNTLVLPDTLYVHTEPTDNRTDRRIILPDSLFPQGHSVRISVKTQLTGPSGEYKEAKNTLTVDRRYARIPRLEIRGDSLLTFLAPRLSRGLRYTAPAAEPPPTSPPTQEIKNRESNTESRESPPPTSPITPPLSPGEGPGERAYATLQTITPQSDTLSQKITLPYAQKLNHQQAKYRLLYDEQEVSQSMTDLSPVSGSPAYWSRDTLLLRFPNPNGQPLRWTLYEETSVLAEGNQDRTVFIRSGFAPGTKLKLHYAYLAGGDWAHQQTDLSTPRYDLLTEHKKVLDLQLTQPAKVKPGETVRIALTATDQQGRPAPNVRLTAGTYNARFDKTPVTVPTYNKRTKRRRSRQDYSREAYRMNRSEVPPGWLVKDFGLDTALAYRLRYPDGEFTFHRDLDTLLPGRIQHAHFAPFVIKNHQPVTIRTVYADDRLVYWWHPDITTPYSIPVDSGWHKISLRTDEHLYTKSVYFESCRQLVLSFDAERWVKAGWARTRVQKWGKGAVDRIWERVFALSHMQTTGKLHFRAGDDGVIQSTNRAGNNSWAPLGLATNNDKLRFWFPGQDSVSLRFEPRATYRITKERDRLYPLERETIENFMKGPARSGPAAPELPEYFYKVPPQAPRRQIIPHAKRLPRLVPLEPASRIQFTNLPKEVSRIILAPVAIDDYFYTSLSTVNSVKPGTYDVLYHFRNDSVFHQQIELGEDSLTLLAFRRENVQHFNNFDRFGGYSMSKPPKEPEPEVSYVERVFNGDRISGVALDEDGMPLIGLTILIEGTTTGTVTDFDGRYDLEVPVGTFTLNFSYTGYATQRFEFTNTNYPVSPFKVTMDSSVELLEEIVVVGYGSVRKQNLTGSVIVSSEEIAGLPRRGINTVAGRVAGVSVSDEKGALTIRGLSGLGLKEPLYLIDGVPVENIDDLTPDQIVSINVLKDASATAIYGARGANGVVVVTTKKGDSSSAGTVGANLPPANLRESFSDYAAYLPNLRTDRQGKAVFDITFPDDITAWNTFAVGQDRRRRIGFALERTNAFLPFQAQLYLPRFLVEGDQAEAATLAINREGGERNVRLSFKTVSPLPRRGAGGEGNGRNVFDTTLVDALEHRYPIEAASGADSVTYQFTVQTLDGDQASDGERRSFPVYPKGTEMVSGELLLLTEGNTALPDGFIRPERGPVTLRLPGNRVQQLLNDLDYIVDYPYACTEQTASRLIGLLQMSALRKAENATPSQPSPRGRASENAERFSARSVQDLEVSIQKMVRRLEKLRRPDGGFGWWGSSQKSTPWISLHVYRALTMAERAGQTVANLTSARRYLLGRLPELPVRDQLQIMLALGEEGKPPTDQEMVRIDTFSAPNDYELLAVTRLRQLRGDTVDVQRLLDSSSTHAALGRYWGQRGYYFYRQPLDGRLACGLLAHQILRAAGRKEDADKTINYLLGQSAARNRPGNVPLLGTNTLESARLLSELLPALLDEDDALSPPAVTLRSEGTTTQVTQFPFETEVQTAAVAGLRIARSGSGPLPVSLYQRWFETEPVAGDDGFQLTSRITDKRGRPLGKLTQGETAYLEVTVVSKFDADYVLVEIPIPGGCSYQDRNEARGPWAIHREYQRDRVAIFCDRFPTGSHTYKVALAPRFSGTYTLNPARAEMQYLPVVNGNDGLRTVGVE